MKLIREAITEHFGERCAEFSDECICCKAWAEYDNLINAALDKAFPLTTVSTITWDYLPEQS